MEGITGDAILMRIVGITMFLWFFMMIYDRVASGEKEKEIIEEKLRERTK
jgi:hypothetical protein